MNTSRALVAAALIALLPTPLLAYDATGTWEGKTACKGFADGQAIKQKIDIQARVSQSGRDLNIEFQGLSFVTGASGVAIPSAKKPDKGELGFVACSNTPQPIFGVTGRAKIVTKPSKHTGTIKFVTVVAGKDLSGLGVTDAVLTCTGSLKRTSITNFAIGSCPST